MDHHWVQNIRGALTIGALAEYLDVWDLLTDVVLQPDIQDEHRWRHSESGQYSAKIGL